MSISNYLSNLNAYYSKITALIENIVYINDFGNENTNIADGGNDLFDTANKLIFAPYDTEADLIPYTHTQTDAGGEDGINYTDPPMDGVVADGADYGGGNDSQYFTNMYPGLFVFVGTNLEASAFTVYGNMGSDGEEIVTTDDGNQSVFEGNIYTSEGSEVKYLGQTYTVFTRFSQDEDEDPTLNHIIIVKGSGGTHEYTGSEEEDYYDEVNLEDNNNSEVYFLMFATDDTVGPVTNATAIARKFLQLMISGNVSVNPSPAYTFEVQTYTMPELIGLGYYGDFLTDIIRQREESVVHIINRPLKHGDQFTLYGAEAVRFKKIYADVDNPILKILGNAPEILNNDSYGVLEGSTKMFTASASTSGDSVVTYSLGTENDEADFSINSTTGKITSDDPISIGLYTIEVIATNKYGSTSKEISLYATNGTLLFVNEISDFEQIRTNGNIPQSFIYNTNLASIKGLINSFVGDANDTLAGDVLVLDNGTKILCSHVKSLGNNKINTHLGLDYAYDEFTADSDYITIRRIPVEDCFNATYTNSGPPASGYFYYESTSVYIGGSVAINAILQEIDPGDQIRLFYNNPEADQIGGLNNLFTVDSISYDESNLWTITSSDPSFPMQNGDTATMFKKNW